MHPPFAQFAQKATESSSSQSEQQGQDNELAPGGCLSTVHFRYATLMFKNKESGQKHCRMEKSGQVWDDSLRSLVRANPEAFIKWLLGDAQYKEERPHKLKSWKLEVDALLHAIVDGEDMLVHIEFQTYNDADMSERLLRYNVLTRSEYKLPVLSFVIYLLSDGKVPQSPLSWTVPGGQEVLQFHFRSIKLAEL